MDPSNPTRPVLKMVGRAAPQDPNEAAPLGVSNEDLRKLFADVATQVQAAKRGDEARDRMIGECLTAASKAEGTAARGREAAASAQVEAAAARGEAAGARSEASQAKGIAGRVERRVEAIEGTLERLVSTIGTFPTPEDAVRALQRESQRDLTPGQIEEREAELKRLADGTGLCGMIARGAKTDVLHAEELRRMAKEAAQEAATEGAALGVVEGARQGAALVKKHQRGQLTGIAAVAGTGTFATILAVLYFLGPEGGARVAGAVRAIFTTLFGG
jgi:hypothetical protein